MTKIYLHDGRLIGPENFSIYDSKERRLDAADKWAMRWGWQECEKLPGHALVIARRNGPLITAHSLATRQAAYARAMKLLDLAFPHSSQAPQRNLIAVVNFRPGTGDAGTLSRICDGLFAPLGLETVEPHNETTFLESWVKPAFVHGELGVERRVLVRLHWSRMDKLACAVQDN